jgi:hypothetical protein
MRAVALIHPKRIRGFLPFGDSIPYALIVQREAEGSGEKNLK